MATAHERRPVTVKTLIALGFVSGLVGVLSGYTLMSDPAGEALGITTDLLEGLPIEDFFPVGLLLFTAFGLAPFTAAYGLLTKREVTTLRKLTAWSGHHWGWTGLVAVAAVELAWMAVEALLIGLFGITVFWSLFQTVVLIVCVHPTVRRFYSLV